MLLFGGWLTVEDRDRTVASQSMAPGGTVAVKVTREGPHFPIPETQPEAQDFDLSESPQGYTVAFPRFQAPLESGRSGSRAGCGVGASLSRPVELLGVLLRIASTTPWKCWGRCQVLCPCPGLASSWHVTDPRYPTVETERSSFSL